MSEEKTKLPLAARVSIFIAAVGLVLLISAGLMYDSMAKVKETYTSPDGKYALQVLAYPRFVKSEADESKAPGKLRLVTADGAVVDQRPLDHLSDVTEPKWSTDKVVVSDQLQFELLQDKPGHGGPADGAPSMVR